MKTNTVNENSFSDFPNVANLNINENISCIDLHKNNLTGEYIRTKYQRTFLNKAVTSISKDKTKLNDVIKIYI